MTRSTLPRILAIATVTALFMTACGSSSGDSTTTTSPATSTAGDSTSPSAAATDTAAPDTTTAPETTSAPPPSTTAAPEPLADQTPPSALNGIEVVGDTMWIASINANQVIEVDRTTGAILTRVDTGAAGPDDVALGPDGAVYWTGFTDGTVGRIEDGQSTVVTTLEPGANPLGFTSDGDLVVGLAVTADALYLLPGGQEPAELIARDLGDLNAFDIRDRLVFGPTGGVAGPGTVSTVDLDTGSLEVVASDLPSVTASTFGDDGLLYLLSGVTGEVLTFDPDSGEVTSFTQLDEGFYDNLSFGADGSLYVTHFAEPVITVIAPDASTTRLDVGA